MFSTTPPARRPAVASLIASIVGVVVIIAVLSSGCISTLAAPRVNADGSRHAGHVRPSRAGTSSPTRASGSPFGDGVARTPCGWRRSPPSSRSCRHAVLVRCALLDHAWIRVPDGVVLEFFRGMPVLLMMLFILLVFSTGRVLGRRLGAGRLQRRAHRRGPARGYRRRCRAGSGRPGSPSACSPLQTRCLIEFPQAFRQMLPIIIAQLVVLLKDTSLGYIVGYHELLRTSISNLQRTSSAAATCSRCSSSACAIYLAHEPHAVVDRRGSSRAAAGPKLGEATAAARPPTAGDRQRRRRAEAIAASAIGAGGCRRRAAASAPLNSTLVSDTSPDHRPRRSIAAVEAALAAIAAAADSAALKAARAAHAGESSPLAQLNARLRDVPGDQKAAAGKLVGQARGAGQPGARRAREPSSSRPRSAAQLAAERVDVTALPPALDAPARGIRSPCCMEQIERHLRRHGLGDRARAPSSSTSGSTSTR